MTTASPTPFPSTAFGNPRLQRHASARQVPRPQASLRRHSPISTLGHSHGFSANAAPIQNISYADSSDDEIPQPMNFSALTRALLEERPPKREQSPVQQTREARTTYDSVGRNGSRSQETSTPSGGRPRISRRASPANLEDDRASPRIVHLSGSKHSSGLRWSKSVASYSKATTSNEATPHELITPAPRPSGRLPARSRAGSAASADGHVSGMEAEGQQHAPPTSNHQRSAEQGPASGQDSASYKPKPSAEALLGSSRVKRVPLRGAPMRKRLVRRQSEDDENPQQENLGASYGTAQTPYSETRYGGLTGQENLRSQGSGAPRHLQSGSVDRFEHLRAASVSNSGHKSTNAQPSEQHEAQLPSFKVPILPPSLPSLNDQENEPPPTFKRNKPQTSGMLGVVEKISVLPDEKESGMLASAPISASPMRPILAPRSQNTPHRPPPPPPKMTVLETATATAGASAVKSKKKRSHITVNGKMFTLMGKIGKGGSSDVYRVMAENYRMFALKKVNLEDINEDAVRGYKGEIELLKKLENLDRVVRLLDWEVNEQKQSLSVLMEIGESDLNRLLSLRLHPENAKFDISFTRHYWREMLECVLAVHQHDIVHSDLKPANFLLVQGRLKLIDFGIANAIDIDNTVNVHRETNVGTPNYMSPESLQDTNHAQRGPTGPNGVATSKLMKLGKPSDIWSLGCILYQMAYGKPPFAHIANQYQRIMAIINPAVVIEYPPTGVGGATVPSSLRRTLRRCLNRDFSQRPTAEQLLDERDSFLDPDMENDGAVAMTEELLGQILAKVVERCRDPKRGPPSDAELATYPKGFFGKIRGRLEEV